MERPARTPHNIGVRARGKPTVTRLDARQLRQDILKATFYTGPEHTQTVRQIADEVVRKIVSGEVELAEANLDEIVNNNAGRLGDVLPSVTYLVEDEAIVRQVDHEMNLHEKLRVERVQYSLVFRGRTDVPGRDGWREASDALEWLEAEYDLGAHTVVPAARAEAMKWELSFPLRTPEFVVKNHERPQARFVLRQFTQTLDKVLFGRHDAARKTAGVASWVMNDLAGQRVVTSNQLAASALNCLRKVDDIAYLRAATNLKRLAQVSAIAVEARSLITHPSAPIKFAGTIPTGWFEEPAGPEPSATSAASLEPDPQEADSV